jgi:transcriptional regulator with XRE-family HTH domain
VILRTFIKKTNKTPPGELEIALAGELIKARSKAKLTQAAVAKRMGTSQSAVARMESGRALPSTASLQKYAHAVGRELKVTLG